MKEEKKKTRFIAANGSDSNFWTIQREPFSHFSHLSAAAAAASKGKHLKECIRTD